MKRMIYFLYVLFFMHGFLRANFRKEMRKIYRNQVPVFFQQGDLFRVIIAAREYYKREAIELLEQVGNNINYDQEDYAINQFPLVFEKNSSFLERLNIKKCGIVTFNKNTSYPICIAVASGSGENIENALDDLHQTMKKNFRFYMNPTYIDYQDAQKVITLEVEGKYDVVMTDDGGRADAENVFVETKTLLNAYDPD
jgi:hypothetical protein